MAGLVCAGLRNALAGPFSFTLAAGEALAVSGPSGAGKSLFLRMIADLDPNQGDVTLAGTPRAAIPAPEWRRRVAYLPAESGWWHPMVAAHFPPSADAAPLAERLHLDRALLPGPVARLSSGEKSRMALIRALLGAPDILLLDEPTGALDPVATQAVEALLAERRAAGIAMIAVTHDAAQAERLGGQRAHLANRRFAAPPA